MRLQSIIICALLIVGFLNSIEAQQVKFCLNKNLKDILAFEKKCKSTPLGFDWKDINDKNNSLGSFGSPVVFKRHKIGKIEQVVEYFFQGKTKECTSVIINWDNDILYLGHVDWDTSDMVNEYKAIYFQLAKQFEFDSTKIVVKEKYEAFDKSKYIKSFQPIIYNNTTFKIELIYFYRTTQRRVRLYYRP